MEFILRCIDKLWVNWYISNHLMIVILSCNQNWMNTKERLWFESVGSTCAASDDVQVMKGGAYEPRWPARRVPSPHRTTATLLRRSCQQNKAVARPPSCYAPTHRNVRYQREPFVTVRLPNDRHGPLLVYYAVLISAGRDPIALIFRLAISYLR